MIGKRMKEVRKLRGYTQDDIALKLSVSVSAVKKWEQDKTDPNTQLFIELADFLNVSLDYLLSRSDDSSDFSEPTHEDSLINKIEQLDSLDRIKTEGYVDGLLEDQKYKTPAQATAQ